MSGISKLAIFDVDGTIAKHGIFPNSIISGLKHLQENGYTTTISTGRGYIRAKEALGKNFDSIVSSNAVIIIEHGTKIVDKTGKVVFAKYLSEEEIGHVIDFSRVNIDMIKLIWFNPPEPTERVQVWCYNPAHLKKETEKRGHYADIFSSSFEELKGRLLLQPVSNVTAKLKDFVKVENLKLHFTRTEIDTIFQDGNMEFVSNTANKAVAIAYIEKSYNVPMDKMMIAGNAINDVEMLNLVVGKRILVGSRGERNIVLGYLNNPGEVIKVENPEDLGMYLKKLPSS